MRNTYLNIAATLPMLAGAFLLGIQYGRAPKVLPSRHVDGERFFAIPNSTRTLGEYKNAISYVLRWDDTKGCFRFLGQPIQIPQSARISDSDFVFSRSCLYDDFMDPTALNRNDDRIHYPLTWDESLQQLRYNGLAYPFIPPFVRPRFKLDSCIVGFPAR